MTPPVGPVLVARDLTKTYLVNGQRVDALRGVSLTIVPGEYLAITGPSGSGKSTLLQLIGGLDLPTTGHLELMGTAIEQLSDRQLADLRLRRVGFIFQRFHLMPVLSAEENIELPLAEAGVRPAERRERARALLDYVGLSGRSNHRATQLSGGEMQRVAIARALANRPGLILADEPTGELDARTGAQILDLFDQLHRDGTTIVVVTHDEHLAERAARRVHLLDGMVDRDELARR